MSSKLKLNLKMAEKNQFFDDLKSNDQNLMCMLVETTT